MRARKKQHPDHFYFEVPPCESTDGSSVFTFKKLSDKQTNSLQQLQANIDGFQKKLKELLNNLIEANPENPSPLRKYDCAPICDIQDFIKKHGENDVLVGFDADTGFCKVSVYEKLNFQQKLLLAEIQSFINTFEQELRKEWQAVMVDCEKSRMETRYFPYETDRERYTESHSKNDPSLFLLTSPTCAQKYISLTVYEKVNSDMHAHINPKMRKKLNKLYAKTQPVVHKNSLGFELLHRSMQGESLTKYLAKHPKTTKVIGKHTLEFVDLTKADDYRFFINTVLTRPSRLRELIEGDPKFFNFTPFMSTCLLDKVTRGFAGGHQSNLLPPFYFALSVPVSAINYLGPTDIGSPYACGAMKKVKYLQHTTPIRATMDCRQALYQLKALETDKARVVPSSPYHVRPALESDKQYKSAGYKFSGCLPLYTPDGLLKDTSLNSNGANSYCEGIILGNAMNDKEKVQGKLLLVEKFFLEDYIANKHKKAVEHHGNEVEESLDILANISKLTNGRIQLALIETDMDGYKHKQPVLDQLNNLEDQKEKLRMTLVKCEIRAKRFSSLSMELPKNLIEEWTAVKQEIQHLAAEQQYLVELAKAPPRVTRAQQAAPLLLSGGHKGAGSAGAAGSVASCDSAAYPKLESKAL